MKMRPTSKRQYEWEEAAIDDSSPRCIILAVLRPEEKRNIKQRTTNYYDPFLYESTDISHKLNVEDDEEVKERIRLPNVILTIDENEKDSPSFATFIRPLHLNKITLFDHTTVVYSKISNFIRQVSANDALVGDEWRCQGRLMNATASDLEDVGLYNVRFQLKGTITGTVNEVKSNMWNHMSELTHDMEENEPNEWEMADKYVDDNVSASTGEKDCHANERWRRKFKTLTADEKVPYQNWFRKKVNEWEEENKKQNDHWFGKATALCPDISPVYVRIAADDVKMSAECELLDQPLRPFPVVSDKLELIDPSREVGSPTRASSELKAKLRLDRSLDIPVEWTLDEIRFAKQNDNSNILETIFPPGDSSKSFLLTKIIQAKKGREKEEMKDSHRFSFDQVVATASPPLFTLPLTAECETKEASTSAVSILLKEVEAQISADSQYPSQVRFIFGVSDHITLNDWCSLRDVTWSTTQTEWLNSQKLDGVMELILPHRKIEMNFTLEAPGWLEQTLPINIVSKGEQFKEDFDFLLTKRFPILYWRGMGRHVSTLHQLSIKQTINQYLPALFIGGNIIISFHLGEEGIYSSLSIDTDYGKQSNTLDDTCLFGGRAVSLCYCSEHSVSRHSLQLNSGDPQLEGDDHKRINSNPIRVGELLKGVNIEANQYIPQLICDEMLLESFSVTLDPEIPELVVTGKALTHELFFFKKKPNQETKEWEYLIKIHSRLLIVDNFPMLPDDIANVGLGVSFIHSYVYCSNLYKENSNLKVDRHVEPDEKSYGAIYLQRIDERLIKQVGATFYTQVATMADYIQTPIDIANYNHEYGKEMSNTADGEEDGESVDSFSSTSASLLNLLLYIDKGQLLQYVCEFVDFNTLWYGLELTNKSWNRAAILHDEIWYKRRLAQRYGIDLTDPLYSAESLSKLKQYETFLRQKRCKRSPTCEYDIDSNDGEDESEKDTFAPDPSDSNLWRTAAVSLQTRLNIFEYEVMQQEFPYFNSTAEVIGRANGRRRKSNDQSTSPTRPGCIKPHYSIPTALRSFLLHNPPFTPVSPLLPVLNNSNHSDVYKFHSSGTSDFVHSDICWFAHLSNGTNIRYLGLYTGSVFVAENESNKKLGVPIKNSTRQLFFQSSDDLPIIRCVESQFQLAYKNTEELFEGLKDLFGLSGITTIPAERGEEEEDKPNFAIELSSSSPMNRLLFQIQELVFPRRGFVCDWEEGPLSTNYWFTQ